MCRKNAQINQNKAIQQIHLFKQSLNEKSLLKHLQLKKTPNIVVTAKAMEMMLLVPYMERQRKSCFLMIKIHLVHVLYISVRSDVLGVVTLRSMFSSSARFYMVALYTVQCFILWHGGIVSYTVQCFISWHALEPHLWICPAKSKSLQGDMETNDQHTHF